MEIPSSRGRRAQGAQGQGRRQGQHRRSDRGAGRRWRCGAAPLPAQAAAAPAPAQRIGAPRRQPLRRLPPHRPPRRPRTTRPVAPSGSLPHASPSVRKFARELGVPLEEVKGSGPKGRITQEDVQNFTKAVMSGAGQHQGRGGQGARRRRRRRGAGPAAVAQGRLHQVRRGRAQGPVAHQEDQRRQPAPQLGDDPARHQPRRCRHHRARSLPRRDQQGKREVRRQGHDAGLRDQGRGRGAEEVPRVQQLSLDGDQLVYKQYFHIGFAADTPNGLVVPVLKDADKKGILQISQEMGELAKKARDGKLGPADMQGGCFSISSLGGIGGALLHADHQRARSRDPRRVQERRSKPVWDGKAFQPRLILPLSLSLGPPRDRRRRRRRASTPTWARSSPTSAASLAMTTVVAVRKGGQVAIAADSLVTFGDTRLSHRVEANQQDLQGRRRGGRELLRHGRRGGALPGAAQGAGGPCRQRTLQLGSKDEVFDTFTQLHPC